MNIDRSFKSICAYRERRLKTIRSDTLKMHSAGVVHSVTSVVSLPTSHGKSMTSRHEFMLALITNFST